MTSDALRAWSSDSPAVERRRPGGARQAAEGSATRFVRMRTSSELDAVKDDCLHMLMTAAALRHRATSYSFAEAPSRFDIHMWMTEIRAIENNLIVRVCRFDEEGRNQTGLRTALRSIEAQLTNSERKEANAAVKRFRQAINPLKTQWRNKVSVHLDVETKQAHDAESLFDLPGVITRCRPAVHAVDAIAGAQVDYTLQSGRYEKVDLRKYCAIDE